jgi:hypothetical protein
MSKQKRRELWWSGLMAFALTWAGAFTSGWFDGFFS